MSHDTLYTICSDALACSVVLPSVVLLAKRKRQRVTSTGKGRPLTRVEKYLARKQKRKEQQLLEEHKLRISQQRAKFAQELEHKALQQMFYIQDFSAKQLRQWYLMRSRVRSKHYDNLSKDELLKSTHPNYENNQPKPWEE